MNGVSIDKIIQLVTHEVVKQLKANGVPVIIDPKITGTGIANALVSNPSKSERIDMSKYKTPILTERHISKLHELTGKIFIPHGTLITPKARETAKRNNILIEME